MSVRTLDQRSEFAKNGSQSKKCWQCRNFLEHLVGLRMTSRRSPAGFNHSINVYWRKDVEAKALEVWGSMDNLEAELIKREEQKQEFISFYLRFFDQGKRRRRRQLSRETWPVRPMRSNIKLDKPGSGQGLMSNASGRVVLAAIGINGANFICKVRNLKS